jgi:hypothetical protein
MTPDELLQGAIDLHAHGSGEFSLARPGRVDDLRWAELALEAGMRGFVIKSHVWPTTATASLLRTLHPDLEIFGSITLNPSSGGINAVSVEIAAQLGARVVWMPTWSARRRGAGRSIYLERMKQVIETLDVERAEGVDGLTTLGADGELSEETLRILDVCRRYDLTLASGHLPKEESLMLAQAASSSGVRFVFTHPLNHSISASIDEQIEIARLGAFIEHTFIASMPMHHQVPPRDVAEAIEAVGPEHCVMATDAIEAWNPPAPELMRMFIASMLALGISQEAVHYMTHDNPANALGIARGRGIQDGNSTDID